MKMGILRILCLVLTLLLTPATSFGQGKGNGGGGGKGGGGSDSCSPEAYTGNFSQAVVEDGGQLSIGGEPVNGDDPLRLANEITAVERPDGSYLVAVSMTTSPSVSEQVNRLGILTFDPGLDEWDLLRITNVQTLVDNNGATFSLTGRTLILADLDSDGTADDLLAGGPHAVLFFDVDSPAPVPYQVLQSEPGSQGFARALAFADVDGDASSEIIVGSDTSAEVFVYDVTCPGLLQACDLTLMTHLESEARFGSSLVVDSSGGLYVGAQWAKVGKKNEAGKIFYFPDVLGNPLSLFELERANPERNEELGAAIVLADFSSTGTGPEQLVAAPRRSGGSMAAFPGSDSFAGAIVNEEFSLETTPDHGLVESLSTAAGVVVQGTPNACANTGVIYKAVPGNTEILWSPDPFDGGFFGWGSFAVGDVIFVTERGRDQDGNGVDEGQIYVFDLN